MSYNGEDELFKAKLGIKFKCAICGKIHDPQKNGWKICLIEVRKKREVPKSCFIMPKTGKYIIRKGKSAVEKLFNKYIFDIKVYEDDFELLTVPKKVLERYNRAVELCKAGMAVFYEKVEKLPDIPIEVTNVQLGGWGEIITININGEEFNADYILETFFCSPTGSWSSSENSGKYFYATNYSIYKIDKNLRYALVQRRDTKYKNRQLLSLDKRYYLVSKDNYIEIPENLRKLAGMTMEEIIKKWGENV